MTKSTQEMSSMLYEAGQELGRVNMTREVKPADKLAHFSSVQMKLYGYIARITKSSAMWRSGNDGHIQLEET